MTTAEPLQASSSTHPDRSVDHTVPTAARRGLHVRCGVDDGNDVQLGHADRPTWRGRIHVIGLVVAIPAVSALVLFSNVGTGLRIALAVYAVGLCTMLGASATYHRWVHGLRARCVWRRIDHAAIFAAIAGSSTPILLASLPGATGVALIGAVWSAALLGAGFKLSCSRIMDGAIYGRDDGTLAREVPGARAGRPGAVPGVGERGLRRGDPHGANAAKPGFARRVFDRVRTAPRWEQDNEQWHLLIMEELTAAGERRGLLRSR
jgi:hypothetical protein